MAILYVLLAIIALGVLSLSDEGRAAIKGLSLAGIIAGLLFVGFWVVVLIWMFFSSETGKDLVPALFGYSLLYIGYRVYDRYKKGLAPLLTRGIGLSIFILLVGGLYLVAISPWAIALD